MYISDISLMFYFRKGFAYYVNRFKCLYRFFSTEKSTSSIIKLLLYYHSSCYSINEVQIHLGSSDISLFKYIHSHISPGAIVYVWYLILLSDYISQCLAAVYELYVCSCSFAQFWIRWLVTVRVIHHTEHIYMCTAFWAPSSHEHQQEQESITLG